MVTETLAPLQRLIPQLKQRLETSTYLQLLMDGEAAGVGLDTLFKTGPFPQFLNELDPPETPEPLKRPGEPPNCPQHLRPQLATLGRESARGLCRAIANYMLLV